MANRNSNRNDDLDEGLPGKMFSGIVTAAQDYHRGEQTFNTELRNLGVEVTNPNDPR